MQLSVSESISETQWLLTSTRFEEWMKNDVFHFRWWFLLGFFIISAYTYWKMVDRSRLTEITLFTALVTILTLVLDELGEELTFWVYPVDIVPLFPPLTSVDLASLPIVYSLIYQYCNGWWKFTIASIVTAAIFSFILEPLLVWGGFYQTLTWKYYYGFPLYIAMAICLKAVVSKLFKITESNKS